MPTLEPSARFWDGIILPVRFVGPVLQDAELRYHPTVKEVIALLRVLNTCHTMITSYSEKKFCVYTRYSLFKSKTMDGRCLKWAVNLSPWDLDIWRVEIDEDGWAAILVAGITPRERLDEVAKTPVPEKGSRIKTPPVSLEAFSSDRIGHLLSFDGAANRDSLGVLLASSGDSRTATVNEAEYFGLVKGMQLALDMGVQELVVVGDSRLAIQQLQGGSKSLRQLHMKRDFNAATDYISKRVIQDQAHWRPRTPENASCSKVWTESMRN
ncbi:hypothetical protein PHMEG_00028167 [Phytophthora megakarya]|uniref:Uncharacterized protein n=1 Tax=Phytophthora megakarya TaxID=4795 RepID=A0A225V561_9STRA|nr:hypothetical protein PHMEG_00028167 [Phytophthora megakarya]